MTGSSPIWNTGAPPNASCVTAVEMTAAAIVAMSTSGEKFFVSSSRQKITPASGALKAAARPAPEPAVKRKRSSARERFFPRLTPCPTQAPSCTLGPSRPSDMPAPMASTPPTNFAASTRAHSICMRPKSIPLICGMPLPEHIGSNCTMRQSSQASPARHAKYPPAASGPCAAIHA